MRVRFPLVKTQYRNDVDMVSFKKIATWDYPLLTGFQYDSISDDQICEAMKSDLLSKVDIERDWQDDTLFDDSSMDFEFVHALRIAVLILSIERGNGVKPVFLDTMVGGDCCSCIFDGHHRIRALQYLGYTHFPVSCSGEVRLINQIVDKRNRKKIVFEGL